MGLWTALKRSFVAGIVLLIPLLITLYVLQVLAGFALTYIDPVVQGASLEQYVEDVELLARAIAVALIVSAVTLVGYIAQQPFGQRLFGGLGRIVLVIPLVRTIYSTVRQLSTSFTSSETSYESLVLVEFPRKGIYAIGLVTGESPQAANEVAGTRTHNVFLPSSPNPASGRLVLVPEDELHEVDLSVRQGLRLLMTTGAGDSKHVTVPESIDVPIESTEIETAEAGIGGSDDGDGNGREREHGDEDGEGEHSDEEGGNENGDEDSAREHSEDSR